MLLRSQTLPVRRFVWFSNLVATLLVLGLFEAGESAHSRRRFVVRRDGDDRYDRSITTFSAEGRLAQVEYGMESSLRGSTAVTLKIGSDNDKSGGSSGICLVLQNSSYGKVHRLDHHLWLVTAGLSGDARTLAQILRDACQDIRSSYGESPTTKEVAKLAGSLQHQLTRTGGARPFGCTAFVVGVDPSSLVEENGDDRFRLGNPQLYQTDPGGIVEECSHGVAGRNRDAVLKVLSPMVETKGTPHAYSSSTENDGTPLEAKAAAMARQILSELNSHAANDDDDQTVDVWIIRPHAHRRGGTQAMCYRGVTLDTVSRIHNGIT
jgi:20S proteasome alpha/beta subunit